MIIVHVSQAISFYFQLLHMIEVVLRETCVYFCGVFASPEPQKPPQNTGHFLVVVEYKPFTLGKQHSKNTNSQLACNNIISPIGLNPGGFTQHVLHNILQPTGFCQRPAKRLQPTGLRNPYNLHALGNSLTSQQAYQPTGFLANRLEHPEHSQQASTFLVSTKLLIKDTIVFTGHSKLHLSMSMGRTWKASFHSYSSTSHSGSTWGSIFPNLQKSKNHLKPVQAHQLCKHTISANETPSRYRAHLHHRLLWKAQ